MIAVSEILNERFDQANVSSQHIQRDLDHVTELRIDCDEPVTKSIEHLMNLWTSIMSEFQLE